MKQLARNAGTGGSGMRVLREVEGQHQRFIPHVLDFDTASGKRGLGDESDLGIEFAEFHFLMIPHFELSNPAASAVRVE